MTILIKVNPLSSLLINKFRPLHILGNQTLVQLRIIGNPSLLTDNIGDGLALRLENFLDFGTRLEAEVLAFDDEGRFFKLMEGWGGGEGPFEGVGDEGDNDVFAFSEGGKGADGCGLDG